MPAGGFLGFFLRLLRQDEGCRRFIARRRRHGVGGLRRHNRNVQRLRHLGGRRRFFGRDDRRRFRRYNSRRFGGRPYGLGVRRGGGDGAGPSGTQAEPPAPLVMPGVQPLPAWILAGPAAPNLYADEEMELENQDMDIVDPELAPPPPPTAAVLCTRLGLPTPCRCGARRRGGRASGARSPDLPSPTPAHELVSAGTAPPSTSFGLRLPAPAVAHGDIFNNGAGSSNAPAPPPSRRIRFVVPRSVLEASRAGRKPGQWSPVRLGLSNGHSNGVAPGTQLPGGSSSEEEDGAPGPSVPRH